MNNKESKIDNGRFNFPFGKIATFLIMLFFLSFLNKLNMFKTKNEGSFKYHILKPNKIP